MKRLLSFYRSHFNFHPPYRVVVDGTFCKAALTFKINISEQMPKYLMEEVEMVTTQCAIKECELLGSLLYGPLKLLRQYRLISCGHAKNPKSASQCLLSLANNRQEKNNYFFATQV